MSIVIDVKASGTGSGHHVITIAADANEFTLKALAELVNDLEYEVMADAITVEAIGIGVAVADLIAANKKFCDTAVVSYYPPAGGTSEVAAEAGIEQYHLNKKNRIAATKTVVS